MRQPIRFIREAGFRSFLTLQFFIGIPPILYILSPFVLLLSFAASSFAADIITFPNWLYTLSIFNLIYGALAHISFALIANLRSHNAAGKMFKPLIFSALTFPLYTILLIISSFGSLRELIMNPHYWEKTQHGLAKTP
jgi:hypothetical protein